MKKEDFNKELLSELSRHYDTTQWTVFSLWVAVIGGFFLYTEEHFNEWYVGLGLSLTIIAMYLSASFRAVRRKVHEKMSKDYKELHQSLTMFKQWKLILVLYILLGVSWIRLLWLHYPSYKIVWLLLGSIVVSVLVLIWWLPDKKSKMTSHNKKNRGDRK